MTAEHPGRRAPSLRESFAPPRRGLRRPEAALYLAMSPSKFDDLVKDGRMPKGRHVDSCVIWDIRALNLAFDALMADDAERNPWD